MFASALSASRRLAGPATSVSLFVSSWTSERYSDRAVIVTRQYISSRLLQTPKQYHWQQSQGSLRSSSSRVNSNGNKNSCMQWYEKHLERQPVPTKMLTGTILWSMGDAVAQVIPQFSVHGHFPEKYDWERTGRAALFGFALHAPLSHLHFNFLEWMTVKAGYQGLSIPIFKTIMEQFVYWSWISNSLYHGAMAAMQGLTTQQCYHRITEVLWDTQVAQWTFWIPIQLLNFQFVPVRHQLNVVLLTSIVWTALLSMWYPPQTDVDVNDPEILNKRIDSASSHIASHA